jgi:excinuclease ABC subunit C
MKSSIQNILDHLPTVPGVYIMKNASGKIIYVGKSVNLRSRVQSYFHEGATLNAAKQQLIRHVEHIDTIEVHNEIEALVLETNLIKQYLPKYNVLMKDGKNLGYLCISDEVVPQLYKTRQKPSNGQVFGPFPPGTPIALCAKQLKRLFHIRSCRIAFEKYNGDTIIKNKHGMTLPCIDYYI